MTAGIRGPLSGLRVLDLSHVVSGPYATQLLSDLGAEVIRVGPLPSAEQIAGDARFVATGVWTEAEAFGWGLNRGKYSINLDLKKQRGRELFLRLAAESDVVCDNFRPGVRTRLGIDHAALTAIDPAIISCSITGFGRSGPWAGMPAYDAVVQAMSGAMHSSRSRPDGPPVRWGIPIGDLFAGIAAAIGVLAAVIDRDATGVGQDIDISMLDVMLALDADQVPLALTFGREPVPGRGRDAGVHGTFECSDGTWIALGVDEHTWPAAARVLGRPELLDDGRCPSARARVDELAVTMTEVLRARTAAEWQADFLAAGVAAGRVTRVNDVFDHPQLRARSMLVPLRDEYGHSALVAGDPLASGDPRAWRAPSRTGADTLSALHQILGLGEDELTRLQDEQVVYARAGSTPGSGTFRSTRARADSPSGRPLSETLLLELAGAGPSTALAAQMMADLGARVIRLDHPTDAAAGSCLHKEYRAAWRCGLNRSKQSIVADLESPAGASLFQAMAARADVVLEDLRSDDLKRLGADHASLVPLNRQIISCSVTGFGQTGPWASHPSDDATIQALGGGQSLSVDPSRPAEPVRWRTPIGGQTGSMYAVLGMLAALRGRNLDGNGREIDLALLDAQAALLAYRVPQALTVGKQFVPEPGRSGTGALPFGVLQTRDGRWFTICITQRFWAAFCRVIERPDLIDDTRFGDEAQRQRNEPDLDEIVGKVFATRTADEWTALFLRIGLPGAAVATVGEAFTHEQARFRQMLTTLDDPEFPGGVAVAGSPFRLSRTGPARHAPAPLPGRDTAAIAEEFGVQLPRDASTGDGVPHGL